MPSSTARSASYVSKCNMHLSGEGDYFNNNNNIRERPRVWAPSLQAEKNKLVELLGAGELVMLIYRESL